MLPTNFWKVGMISDQMILQHNTCWTRLLSYPLASSPTLSFTWPILSKNTFFDCVKPRYDCWTYVRMGWWGHAMPFQRQLCWLLDGQKVIFWRRIGQRKMLAILAWRYWQRCVVTPAILLMSLLFPWGVIVVHGPWWIVNKTFQVHVLCFIIISSPK